eukprot:CAMPEP_0113668182 /NCGR_PEP_ID=MMETSP0038_2-20120614/3857_1 /TAXON_ID=2898 /ORGANISM="Cryptomonas paramecium" /LENGTH=271 /DNA_ID=CAMNT_0000583895 /DNA_START=42 /DNA_END=855 /DNA_ORIENTATION=+ /assembly_acc=CAM_ASM_000170
MIQIPELRQVLLLGMGAVLSTLIVLSTFNDIPTILMSWQPENDSPTSQLATWKVTGTLNPVIGGVQQIINSPTVSPSAVPTSPVIPVAQGSPGLPAPQQAAPPARPLVSWVPPPKPWEPLAEKNVKRLERTNRELVRGDMENANMVKKLRSAMRLLKKQFALKIVSLEQAYDRRLAREARILHQRINTVAMQPGPTGMPGPQGLPGPAGPAGKNGAQAQPERQVRKGLWVREVTTAGAARGALRVHKATRAARARQALLGRPGRAAPWGPW